MTRHSGSPENQSLDMPSLPPCQPVNNLSSHRGFPVAAIDIDIYIYICIYINTVFFTPSLPLF